MEIDRIQEYKIEELCGAICLGIRGEKNATQISFDVSAWGNSFQDGDIAIFARRPQQDDLYIADASPDATGKKLVWIPNEYDTEFDGTGEIEIRLTSIDPAVVIKARCYTVVHPCQEGTVQPIQPAEQTWVDRVATDIVGKVQEAEDILDEVRELAGNIVYIEDADSGTITTEEYAKLLGAHSVLIARHPVYYSQTIYHKSAQGEVGHLSFETGHTNITIAPDGSWVRSTTTYATEGYARQQASSAAAAALTDAEGYADTKVSDLRGYTDGQIAAVTQEIDTKIAAYISEHYGDGNTEAF